MAKEKEFTRVERYPADMSSDELQGALLGLKDSEVMRSLLMAEVQAVQDGAEREARTMRSLWYSLVKPALSRLGILDARTNGGKPVAWDRLMSKYLAELVRAGLTSYEELSIIDGSRQRQRAARVTRSIIDPVTLVGAHYPWLILFTEKDAIWGEVAALASLYGVSAISGGGKPSFACTENTVKAIQRSDVYRQGQDLVVLSLTDFDPSGYIIANAQFTQVQETARGCDVRHVRLGLEPEQLTAEERAKSAYTPKPDGLSKWYRETGGVDGQPLGLELDALPLSRLRGMFADGITDFVDLDARRTDLYYAFVDKLACELIKPTFDAWRADAIAAVTYGDTWARVIGTDLPDRLFRAAAVAGWGQIDPTSTTWGDDEPLFDCVEEVKAVMWAALED